MPQRCSPINPDLLPRLGQILRYECARGLKHRLPIWQARSHSSPFRVSLVVFTNPLRRESVAECGRLFPHNPHRSKICHAAFSRSIEETEGVKTIVRSSWHPTSAKQSKRHTVSGRCEVIQGCRPQRRDPTGIVRREINTNEMDH